MRKLSKYECTRVIGLRALELQNGSPHLVEIKDPNLIMNFTYVAALELKKGCLDFKINRKFPMNNIEQVHSKDFAVHPDVDVLINTLESKHF